MRNVILLGDATDHGGKVISASPNSFVDGRAIARRGDACVCPRRGHHHCVIVEGDPAVLIDGIPVAFEGHKTSCGATLIASTANCGRRG